MRQMGDDTALMNFLSGKFFVYRYRANCDKLLSESQLLPVTPPQV